MISFTNNNQLLPLNIFIQHNTKGKEEGEKLALFVVTNQGARTRIFIVPWLFAVTIVGLSLFQHTALMKYDPASSSASSASELNLCQAAGLDIACKCRGLVNNIFNQLMKDDDMDTTL